MCAAVLLLPTCVCMTDLNNENIIAFDITMKHPLPMSIFNSFDYIRKHFNSILCTKIYERDTFVRVYT